MINIEYDTWEEANFLTAYVKDQASLMDVEVSVKPSENFKP